MLRLRTVISFEFVTNFIVILYVISAQQGALNPRRVISILVPYSLMLLRKSSHSKQNNLTMNLFLILSFCALACSTPIPAIVARPHSFSLQTLNELFPPMPPHCARATVTDSHSSRLSGSAPSSTRHRISIGVGQTVCFHGENSTSDLHTLTLTQLEQYHPISQRYRFALPEVETKCICECSASSATCQASDFAFGRCDSTGNPSTVCHRTFFANQPSTGCMAGAEPANARLCCDLKFRPYQNRTFTALKLGAPSTFAVLQYTAFSWVEGRWSEEDKRTIRFNVDSNVLNQFMDSPHNYKLSLNALGKSANALNAGMYFVENLPHGSYGEIAAQPLNEITDYNVERLGWYRQDDNGQFYISSGSMMIDKMHRAKAENCKDQKYLSVLDANYYINKDWNESTKFDLADSLRSTFLWIKKARIHDADERHVVVTANEGATIEVTLTASSSNHLTFVHNASKIEDFAGKIVVDSRSNSVMRLSVINATGILNGYIRHMEDHHSVHIDSFSVHIPEGEAVTKTVEVRIKPYTAHTYHMVCLQPEDAMEELCRPVEAVVEARSVPEMSNNWMQDHSDCPECNQITLDGIMKYLNPVSWVQNVSSFKDFVVLIADVIMFVLLIILLYCVLSKCVYPLLKCCICPGSQCIKIMKK